MTKTEAELPLQFILEGKIQVTNLKKVGIYFLINNNKIVYIGKTISGDSRILSHYYANQIEFDSYYLHTLNVGLHKHLSAIESAYIFKYKPIHNKKIESFGKYSTWADFFRNRPESVFYRIERYNIKCFKFGKMALYKIKDLERLIQS